MTKRSNRNPKRQQPGRPTANRQPAPRPGPATAAPAAKAALGRRGAEADPAVYARLTRFNLIMGALHLLQGILMIALSNDTTYPIYSNFLTFDTAARALVPDPKIWLNLRFGPAVGLFLLISAVAHFSLATWGNKWYIANLKKGMNPARFYEYALSSSLMIVLIGMLVGVWDLGAIIAIFGINACMNLFGLVMELHNQTTARTDWTSYIYGCFAGIIPWVVIFVSFIVAVNSGDAKPPAFVYAIIPTIFVFFNCFAVNMYLQYRKIGKWKDYLYGERVYIILSLVAKTALAWMIFAGTLAPV